MLDIFESYATDSKLEVEGTWRKVQGGAELLIARAQNQKYVNLLAKLWRENEQLLDRKNADGTEHPEATAKSEEIMIEVMANTVLLGWKNVSYKRQPLNYSVENAAMLLKHRDFRQLVASLSSEIDAYRLQLEDEQGKA